MVFGGIRPGLGGAEIIPIRCFSKGIRRHPISQGIIRKLGIVLGNNKGVKRFPQGGFYDIVNMSLVFKFNLGFRWVHIYIDFARVDGKK